MRNITIALAFSAAVIALSGCETTSTSVNVCDTPDAKYFKECAKPIAKKVVVRKETKTTTTTAKVTTAKVTTPKTTTTTTANANKPPSGTEEGAPSAAGWGGQ